MRASEFIAEADSYQPPSLSVGDKILKGKFKNSPAEIKGFTKDKHNQPVLKTNKGDVQLFKPRVAKLMKEEVVTELFQSNKKWQWSFTGSHEAVAVFHVNEIPYRFYAYCEDMDGNGPWEIEFKNASRGTDRTGKFGLTGTGNSAEVLSTIVDIMRAFLEKYKGKVTELVFAAKEDSRQGLYARMVKRLLPNWKLHQDGESFVLTAPEEVLTELFDPKTSFPLEWENQDGYHGGIHAEAHDADGRVIDISFTPSGNDEVIEIVFSRGGNYDMTGKGDAPRVMATVIKAINIYLKKYRPPYVAFSAKSSGGRASAYAAMIKRIARDYTLLQPNQYPAVINDFLEFMGSDQPFVLART